MSSFVAFATFVAGLLLSTHAIQISTQLGDIEGVTVQHTVHQFLNVPYAEPPINELRWRPPQPLAKTWEGVYDATKYGNGCAQPSATWFFSNDSGAQFVEDCLYLNVFTPYNFQQTQTEPLRPVFFWIHGGGLSMGTAMSAVYNASLFVKQQDVVTVTINYRLGRMAWFVDPMLSASRTGNGGATGFLDMIEALRWVQSNIRSFGGDPNQVTIGGESGGGWGVCGLVLSPLARGLFKRSIQMSGSCVESTGRFRSVAEGYRATKRLAKDCNVSTVEELRHLDVQTIVDAGFGSVYMVLPVTDGYVFPLDTIELLRAGHVNGESTMIGTTFREAMSAEPWQLGYAPQNESDLYAWYRRNFHDTQIERIRQYYPFNDIGQIWKYDTHFEQRDSVLVQSVQTDCWVRCGSLLQSDIIAKHPVVGAAFPVFFYQFGAKNVPWDRWSHGNDVLQLFGDPQNFHLFSVLESMLEAYDEEFSEQTGRFFGDYIKGILPTDSSSGVTASVQNGKVLFVVDEIRVMDVEEISDMQHRCQLFWDHLGRDAYDNVDFCIVTMPDASETLDPQQFAHNTSEHKTEL